MDGFKDFYNNKNGKMILFFGFYLIFFIFLAFYMKSLNDNKTSVPKDEIKQEETITTYDLSYLINNDYIYNIVITDNDDIITFNGTKNNIDYGNYSNKYFLDIYNINQLLKRSRLIGSKDLVLSYELLNSEINDILLTNKENGINKIDVLVNKTSQVEKITMDLSKYMEKEKYLVVISYKQGEQNENSVSWW